MKRLRIGVIGTGHMGTNHVRNLASEEDLFDVRGIYDADIKRAEEVGRLYDIKPFRNLDDFLKELDAVIVAVPSSLHMQIGLKVAQSGVNALIEKPLAINGKDAKALAAAFAEKHLILQVGHIERFNPVISELDKIIEKEEVVFLEAHRYSPFSGSGRITDASVIEDLMIHDIDLACHLMKNAHVNDIAAAGKKINSNSYDFATCMLKFDNGAHAVISASRVSQGKERMIDIHTLESHINADLLNRTLTISKNTNLTVGGPNDNSYRQDGIVQKIFVPIVEPLKAELKAFYNAVANGAPIAVPGDVGAQAVSLCEEIAARIGN